MKKRLRKKLSKLGICYIAWVGYTAPEGVTREYIQQLFNLRLAFMRVCRTFGEMEQHLLKEKRPYRQVWLVKDGIVLWPL